MHYQSNCFYTATPLRSSSPLLCESTVQKELIQSVVLGGYRSTNTDNCSARKLHSTQNWSNVPVKSYRSNKNKATISFTSRILDLDTSRFKMNRNLTTSSTITLGTYTSSYFSEPGTNCTFLLVIKDLQSPRILSNATFPEYISA